MRSLLYAIARLLGDLGTARRGIVGRRVARRAAGKVTGRLFRKVVRQGGSSRDGARSRQTRAS